MQKVSSWLLVSLVALLGGYLLRDRLGPFDASVESPVQRRAPQSLALGDGHSLVQSQASAPSDKIRIASFHITAFNADKCSKPKVIDVLARVIRKFDIVAIQGIRSIDQTFVPHFLSQINRDSEKYQYEYELGPRVGRNTNQQQFAFFFNKQTVEIDRQATYTVADPHDRILFEPLVALFRARTMNADTAFTFKLVNLHLDPLNTSEELGMY